MEEVWPQHQTAVIKFKKDTCDILFLKNAVINRLNYLRLKEKAILSCWLPSPLEHFNRN